MSATPEERANNGHNMLTFREEVRRDLTEMRHIVEANTAEVSKLRDVVIQGWPKYVSVNDATSIAPYERLVTMTDSQRLVLAAGLRRAEEIAAVTTVQARQEKFWQTRWGKVSVIIGILASIILILGTVYQVFFGLAHSVLSGHP